jgi:hypothetical protein
MLAADYRVVERGYWYRLSKAASNFESYFSLEAERLKAPHSKFACDYPTLFRPIPESPNLSALLECESVPHSFPSRLIPASSVAIWVAKIALCSHRNLAGFNVRRGRHDAPSFTR